MTLRKYDALRISAHTRKLYPQQIINVIIIRLALGTFIENRDVPDMDGSDAEFCDEVRIATDN